VAAGGTSATAIATPTSTDPTFRVRLMTAATPEPNARNRARKSGVIRSRICGTVVISNPGGSNTVP